MGVFKKKMINFLSRIIGLGWTFMEEWRKKRGRKKVQSVKASRKLFYPPPDIVCYILRVRLIMHFKIFEGNSPIIGRLWRQAASWASQAATQQIYASMPSKNMFLIRLKIF